MAEKKVAPIIESDADPDELAAAVKFVGKMGPIEGIEFELTAAAGGHFVVQVRCVDRAEGRLFMATEAIPFITLRNQGESEWFRAAIEQSLLWRVGHRRA